MNTNKGREKKVVEVKNTKNNRNIKNVKKTETIKVKFKNDTSISWIRYIKNKEYEIDKKFLNLIKDFIY